MNRQILRLAVPNIISNITVPLLSMVDMAVVGHLSLEVFIGAVATSALIFNFLYWSFSFLRMGTSGFTAQAFGERNLHNISAILLRSLSIAFIVAIVLILLRVQIFNISFHLISSSANIKFYAKEYFDIYIWAAPAVLGMYSFNGWFVGMQDAKTPMIVAIATNIINIILCLFFVYVLHLELKGIALASTIAQIFGFSIAFVFWFVKYSVIRKNIDFGVLKDLSGYIPFFRVNADIFLRTMLLISVTVFFTSTSAKMGDTILAANALLMQLFTLFSYLMDGFAYAAEALTGRYVGEKKLGVLDKMVKLIFRWGGGVSLFFTVLYMFFTDEILNVLTNKIDVINTCKEYESWILLIPVASFSAFLWDGVFIGATASKQMRNSMFVATICFFAIYYSLQSVLENNALWIAFIFYLFMRGIVQFVMYKKIRISLG